jgi:predicted secreted protein
MSTYTDAADVISITPPDCEADASETTHLESTGAWREFIVGFLDGGEAEAMLYVGKSVFNTLHETIFSGRTPYYWRCLFAVLSGESNGSRIDWYGPIVGIGIEDIEDEAVKCHVTIKTSGAVDWTSGS